MARTATCVWRITPELVRALDDQLGLPVDSYVNGTQTWLTEPADSDASDRVSGADRTDGPDVTLEWRLHPVAGFRAPDGLSHYDLWEQVTEQIANGSAPDALVLGTEHRTLQSLWDGLECFVPYGDELEPAPLAQLATTVLHEAPDAVGLVDHTRIGSAWEHANGTVSLVELLLAELHT